MKLIITDKVKLPEHKECFELEIHWMHGDGDVEGTNSLFYSNEDQAKIYYNFFNYFTDYNVQQKSYRNGYNFEQFKCDDIPDPKDTFSDVVGYYEPGDCVGDCVRVNIFWYDKNGIKYNVLIEQ